MKDESRMKIHYFCLNHHKIRVLLILLVRINDNLTILTILRNLKYLCILDPRISGLAVAVDFACLEVIISLFDLERSLIACIGHENVDISLRWRFLGKSSWQRKQGTYKVFRRLYVRDIIKSGMYYIRLILRNSYHIPNS